MNTPTEDVAEGGVGCGGQAFLLIIGLLGLITPYAAWEFREARPEAIALMWKLWLPGALVGALVVIWDSRPGARRKGLASGSITSFGIFGYLLATQSGAVVLGGIVGFSSGLLIAMAIAYAILRRKRRTEKPL